MSAIGTLMATAAFSVGAVAAVKSLRKRMDRAKAAAKSRKCEEPFVELEADAETGVWRVSPISEDRRAP